MPDGRNQPPQGIAAPSIALQEVARPAATVMLSEAAERDLKSFNRVTRSILSRAMRDQLLEPSSWVDFKALAARPESFALPIGKFYIVVRPLEPEPGQPSLDGRFVERIIQADDLQGVEAALRASGQANPGQATAASSG